MPGLTSGRVRLVVEDAAFCRVPVLGPLLLDVDKRALPRTIEIMLERGEREEVRFTHTEPCIAARQGY